MCHDVIADDRRPEEAEEQKSSRYNEPAEEADEAGSAKHGEEVERHAQHRRSAAEVEKPFEASARQSAVTQQELAVRARQVSRHQRLPRATERQPAVGV